MQIHMEYCISNILRLIAHIFLAYNHASSHISGQNVWFWLLGWLIICWSGESHHHRLAWSASWLEEQSQKYVDFTIGSGHGMATIILLQGRLHDWKNHPRHMYVDPTIGIKECGLSHSKPKHVIQVFYVRIFFYGHGRVNWKNTPKWRIKYAKRRITRVFLAQLAGKSHQRTT